MEIAIKKVSSTDLHKLQNIAEKTFRESFSGTVSDDNMKKYLENNLSLDKLKTELENQESEFYFATADDEVIGYLKLNFGQAQTAVKADDGVEIQRIYVFHQFQGKHVGQQLYEKAMQFAAQKGADYVWLCVWENNTRAIKFYQRNGFVEFDRHIFRFGDEEQTDIMMKHSL